MGSRSLPRAAIDRKIVQNRTKSSSKVSLFLQNTKKTIWLKANRMAKGATRTRAGGKSHARIRIRVTIADRSNGPLGVSCKTVFPRVRRVESRRVSHTLVQLYRIGEE